MARHARCHSRVVVNPVAGSQPLVSVVTPAYNAAAYIDESLNSALNQTMADLEVIVVDDGSSDATHDAVLAWAVRDPRVVAVRQDNRGISAARNAALARSRGRFIALLDSDDAWAPGFLEAQLAVFEQMPHAGVVTGNVTHRGGSHDGDTMWPPSEGPRTLRLHDPLAHESSVCIMSVFRREVYETIGGFDVTLRCNEDYQFWLRAAGAGFPIVQSPTPLGWYRRRPDSVSADQAIMLDGIMRVLRETRVHCGEDAEAVAIIDRQLRRFDRERLVLHGKLALLAGRFDEASAAFVAASQRSSSPRLSLVATLCRWSPRLLRALYRTRSSTARQAGRPLTADASPVAGGGGAATPRVSLHADH